MIERHELEQVLQFIAKHWIDISRDPKNKALENLPSEFWMNSVGGPAGKGRWITTLMYTEDEEDAKTFKEVLIRWQSKTQQKMKGPDLIQIKKGRTINN